MENHGSSLRAFLKKDPNFIDPEFAMVDGVIHSTNRIDVTLTSTFVQINFTDDQTWHTPRYYRETLDRRGLRQYIKGVDRNKSPFLPRILSPRRQNYVDYGALKLLGFT